MYIDVAKAFDTFSTGDLSASGRRTVKALEAVGLSVKPDGDHAASFALRLTTR